MGHSDNPCPAWATLLDVALARAREEPDTRVFTFLVDGETEERTLTFAELDRRARAVAGALQQRVAQGARAVLLYPPGLDYIVGLFGCIYAGVVAVPLYPPRMRHTGRIERVRRVIADAQASLLLCSSALRDQIAADLDALDGPAPTLLATDALAGDEAASWRRPPVAASDLAFLQYTSGTTTVPKGVLVTHGNLLANVRAIESCFALDATSSTVIWLPPYHDMGLVGGLIQPLYTGFHAVLMPPAHFLQRPLRWLEAISRHRAAASGGPNFAYELCLRRIRPQDCSALDLSRWRVAFNGAEPLSASTLARFSEAFAPFGFRADAFSPCYGLAEATLLVAGSPASTPAVVRAFRRSPVDGRDLYEYEEAADGAVGARPLVSSGGRAAGVEVAIVDPATCRESAPGEAGEVWIRGESVADGYWSRPSETACTFAATTADGRGPFLRTGDLGFLHDSELFITGRLKDLIIIGGRNFHPQDLELTAERSTSLLRPGGGAAFSVDVDGQTRLVLVHEVDRRYRPADLDLVAGVVRRAVVADHDVAPHTIVLLRPGALPKTSSGKVQRHVCRQQFVEGRLDELGRHPSDPVALLEADAPDWSGGDLEAAVRAYVRAEVARSIGVTAAAVDPSASFAALGCDSLASTELLARVERAIGRPLDTAATASELTADLLADRVLHSVETPYACAQPAPNVPGAPPDAFPLTHGQRALWFLQRLAPSSAAYHIVVALRTDGTLDVDALRRALEGLAARHAALRTVFHATGAEPWQHVRASVAIDCELEDASLVDDHALKHRMQALADRPFDLEEGPLFRVHVLARKHDERVLLLVFHHLVCDFWSLAVIARDLGELYAAQTERRPATLPELPVQYSDYVARQKALLAGPEGERLWEYWRRELASPLPALDLPTDRPRPSTQTHVGDAESLELDGTVMARLTEASRRAGVTPYSLMLAAFQLLLARYSGSAEVVVGSPMSGRTSAQFTDVVGYFVNPVVLRARPDRNLTVGQFIGDVQACVAGALAHQAMPFALLTERLEPARDPSRTPIFQALFVYQQTPSLAGAPLSLFGIGIPGAHLRLGSVVAESMPFVHRVSQFDLTLAVAESAGTLHASVQYNTDLFDAATIRQLLGHFEQILRAMLEEPARRLALVPTMGEAERRQLLVDCNAAAASPAAATGSCIHTLVAAQAARTPSATALVADGETLNYAELNRRANRVAHRLRRAGVGPDVPVGLCVERSSKLLVGMLAILKAGGAYVPLDPAYPPARLRAMLADASAPILVTERRCAPVIMDAARALGTAVVDLDRDRDELQRESDLDPEESAGPANLAYVMYTSGSTGAPKGVMVDHRNVVNFFAGMDRVVGCGPSDTLLAVTSLSFDISVLELLWPLTQGARVVVAPQEIVHPAAPRAERPAPAPIDFSLFYFASDSPGTTAERYRLVIEGAKLADRCGFSAVWTPERHFHEFGGLYPNPAVLGAALAAVTERVRIRAGSVVLPLHDPIRVVEEWSVVDNLSKGRVGLAFASGWHADDFAFFPERYRDRKAITYRHLDTVRRLWAGEPLTVRSGSGSDITIRTRPRPVQPTLPVWLTAAGGAETFVEAGKAGAGVLTHLLGQTPGDVAQKIRAYRDALAANGHDPATGHVTLMLHTFVGRDREAVRATVREPFIRYLRSSVSLIDNLIKSLNLPVTIGAMKPQDVDDLLQFAFDRYFETSTLFGSPDDCVAIAETVRAIGVDEIGCLIDFGVPTDVALEHMEDLAAVARRTAAASRRAADVTLASLARQFQPTLLQCTPSFMRLFGDAPTLTALGSLRALLLGGEGLPSALVDDVRTHLSCRIVNMYGPTETTVWSSSYDVAGGGGIVPIGGPVVNTSLYVLDDAGEPVPAGVAGELYIGGHGVARGYFNRRALTASRFVPDPFGGVAGARLYRTGDLVRHRRDGAIEYIGRRDSQVKLRGHRVELHEVEAVLATHDAVQQVAVVVQDAHDSGGRLVAYVVPQTATSVDVQRLRDHAAERLPAYMVPSSIVAVPELPLTSNGKIDRKRLVDAPSVARHRDGDRVQPKGRLEETIAAVWERVLHVDHVAVHDNFFDRGGHSLLVVSVQQQLEQILGREIPLIKLLQHPTVGSLARFLRQEQADTLLVDSVQRAQRQRRSRRVRTVYS